MSAFGMWQYLMSLFTSKSKGKLMSLHEEARMFKMSNGEKPSSYILRARKIATTIRSLGDEFTELSLCSMILSGLSEDYSDDKKVQRCFCYTNPDVSQLQHALELTYLKLQDAKSNTPKTYNNHRGQQSNPNRVTRTGGAPAAHNAEMLSDTKGVNEAQAGRPAFQQVGRTVVVCHHCNQPGHIIKNCPAYIESLQRAAQSNCAQLQSVSSSPSLAAWLIDSGSTHHICPSSDNMLDYVKFAEPEYLFIANGKREEIVGEGTVQVFLESGNSMFFIQC
jgi:hypothetical protein